MTTGGRYISYDKALEKAMRYCAYQERCLSEPKEKFYTWGVRVSDQKKVLNELLELDYLNEDRFVESFVRGKFNIKRWGRNKIRLELVKKGIDSSKINLVIQEEISDEEYEETISLLIDRKINLSTETDQIKKRDKIYRFLINKGYESELVSKALNELFI